MKSKVNLAMAKQLIKVAEEKLNKLYEDKDAGKLTDMEFAIKASECSGLFNGLAAEASALVQDCLNLPQAENSTNFIDQLAKYMGKTADKEEKDPLDIQNILRKGKIN